MVTTQRAPNALYAKIRLPKQKIEFWPKCASQGRFWVGAHFGARHVPDIGYKSGQNKNWELFQKNKVESEEMGVTSAKKN